MRNKYIIFMARFLLVFWLCNLSAGAASALEYDGIYGKGQTEITLATGSPGSLGLLEALAEPFCIKNNCRIRWIKRGSGASLNALKSGEADVIMVHAPEVEIKALKAGWAADRTLIGGNEFYIVGPVSDPAGIRNASSAADAYLKIAASKSLFFTRNDNSGTYKKELMIWKKAGLKPSGAWYIATNDFMGPTLMRADKEKGYFMTDSSTWYVKKDKIRNLEILYSGDPLLINVYHALGAPEGKKPEKIYRLIKKFIGFLKSEEGQKIISEFGIKEHGTPLYLNGKHAEKAAH